MGKPSKNEWAARFALDSVPGIGCRLQKRLFDAYGSAEAILSASRSPKMKVDGMGKAKVLALRRIEADRPVLEGHAFSRLSSPGSAISVDSMIGYPDAEYAKMLKEIDDPPPFLWFKGDLASLVAPCVAIVGTRRASDYGRRTAYRLAFDLATAGVTVVSGLAYGIDRAAHEGALDAGGLTVAVLGSGLGQVYPRGHRSLASKITESGCLLSEFGPDTLPEPQHFPQRNRIISGLSNATIVVEAFEKAGALITAGFCIDQKRELYAVPGRIDEETSRGTNALIASCAAQLLFSSAQVLVDLEGTKVLAHHQVEKDPLGQRLKHQMIEPHASIPRPKMEQDILDTLMASSKHIDDLDAALEFPGPELWSTILKLECDGEIRALEGNRYERVKRGLFG